MLRRSWLGLSSLTAIICLAACGGGPSPIQTAAERAEVDEIAPAHRTYVEADATLDAKQKKRRLRTLELWELRVTALEQAVQK